MSAVPTGWDALGMNLRGAWDPAGEDQMLHQGSIHGDRSDQGLFTGLQHDLTWLLER